MSTSFSLGKQDVVVFIATRNVDAARAFYRDTLGLSIVEDRPHVVVFDANGISLRVTPVKQMVAASYTVLGWEVLDVAEAVMALTNAGVRFQRYVGYEQDELGIWTAPDGQARVAWFLDPDGNVLSLSQH